jgi:hypothetical protein
MVDALPEPARRYLLHSIEPGTRLARYATFTMGGSIIVNPNGKPSPMKAHQIISVPAGFLWDAEVGSGLMEVDGNDCYIGGEGRQMFRIWGLIPFLKANGPDITRSAAGRLAGESFLIPSSLLPENGVEWEPIDAETAKAKIPIGGEIHEVTFRVDKEGRLTTLSLPRWGNENPQKEFRHSTFMATDFSDEKRFNGYTIPTTCKAGWRHDDAAFKPFFFPVIEEINYV